VPRSGKRVEGAAALALLQGILAYMRKFQSQPVAQLVIEEICLSLGYSGDAIQAQRAADEAGTALRFVFRVPREGTSL
ncbi:ABC transporter substrate-binding protein, partial [Pseudomonas aeruginosa]